MKDSSVNMDDGRPLFQQIADALATGIVEGVTPEGAQVPSINELAAFYRVNPATALKGINLLVDAGVLHKRRGIGMFVSDGARARLLDDRKAGFTRDYVRPLVDQARTLGLTAEHVTQAIRKEMGQ